MLNYKSAKTWRSVLLTSLLHHQTSTYYLRVMKSEFFLQFRSIKPLRIAQRVSKSRNVARVLKLGIQHI